MSIKKSSDRKTQKNKRICKRNKQKKWAGISNSTKLQTSLIASKPAPGTSLGPKIEIALPAAGNGENCRRACERQIRAQLVANKSKSTVTKIPEGSIEKHLIWPVSLRDFLLYHQWNRLILLTVGIRCFYDLKTTTNRVIFTLNVPCMVRSICNEVSR